ncbi:hypothetical protein FB45DRAFT_1042378 [Roridomyces roridus]|uniref:Uncharacterized protein n=1 Tax=Roridomyces roridus TaxID=1738132 RepID=A0AAD7AZ46_9AGAR|nr:hypothetical protein FB45DRAFT_1042378 [Roridomyces roridus]
MSDTDTHMADASTTLNTTNTAVNATPNPSNTPSPNVPVFAGPTVFPHVVHGFNFDPNWLGVVVLSYCYTDRGQAPGAIQHICAAEGLGNFNVYPATPEIEQPAAFPVPRPWLNCIPNVAQMTKASLMAKQVVHGIYEGDPYSFYFLNLAFPQPPFLVLSYGDIADSATELEVKDALITALVNDTFVTKLAHDDHGYVPNIADPLELFQAICGHAKYRRFTSYRSGASRTVWAITIPPISRDAESTAMLQKHLMDPTFTFDVGFHGTAKPWRSLRNELMHCAECHSIEHYKQDCPILRSDAYRRLHGHDADAAWNPISSLPNSLNDNMDAPEPATSFNNQRGGYRGGMRGRGGFGYGRGGRGTFQRGGRHGDKSTNSKQQD